MIKKITQKLKKLVENIKIARQKKIYKPTYKLIEIFKEDDQHSVVIRLIDKNITFNTKPEEILANDFLVDQFSPRDIRALTYLGYLGINSPKYKVLAKRLSQNEKIIFLLKKKGIKEVIEKTADEIIHETDMIQHMNSVDAKTVGYTFASEAIQDEKKEKERLLMDVKESETKDIKDK